MKLWSLIWCYDFTAELCTWQKVLQPSTMGRYPVHRHRLPEKQHCVLGASASLISRCNLPLNTELAAFVTDFKAETRERTGQSLCDVVHAGLRLVPQQSVHGHHHSWSAEATLGAVSLRYPLLPSNRHSVHSLGSWNIFETNSVFDLMSLASSCTNCIAEMSDERHSPVQGGSWSWCCRYPPQWSRRLRGAGRSARGRRWLRNVWRCGEGEG